MTSPGAQRDEFSGKNFASGSQTDNVAQRINTFHLPFEFVKNLSGLFDAGTEVDNYRTTLFVRVIEAILEPLEINRGTLVIDGRRSGA